MKGFSLLEILIVIGILAVIAAVGSGFYMNYARVVELNSIGKSIISDLKGAQAKAMSGEGGLKWGVRFVNSTNDYYEIFSTPSDYNNPAKEITDTIFLSGGLSFSRPVESSEIIIIFDKIKGTVASEETIIASSVNGQSKTITVTKGGNIY